MVPPSLAELLEHVPQLPARLRIESGRRFVEKQQLGLADQCARHREPLFLPARQLDTHASRLPPSSTVVEQLVDRRARADRTIGTGAASLRRSACRSAAFPAAGCPSAARSDAASRSHRCPSTSTSPASAASRPSRISIVVVLPAPLGPSRPKHSPGRTSRSRPSTAVTLPYRLTTPVRS